MLNRQLHQHQHQNQKKKLYNPKLTQEKRKSIQAHINKMKNFVVIDE